MIKNVSYKYKRILTIIEPRTISGKWTIGIIILFFLSLLITRFFIESGQKIDSIAFGGNDLALETSVILMGISGMVPFFTGMLSILKYKERSMLVFIVTAVGTYIFIFILGEFLK